MKIALLNLPFDNNYGGNLQRYALVKLLQDMGHEVMHISLEKYFALPWYKKPYSYTKRILLKYIFRKNISIFHEKIQQEETKKYNILARRFYDKYIPHTSPVYNIKQMKKVCSQIKFDAYLVGSDQVWRKSMTYSIGLSNFYLGFIKDMTVKRVAYAVSLGVDTEQYSLRDLKKISSLYSLFDKVSVREISALKLLEQYRWNVPKPELVLDPTLLLNTDDYLNLIQENDEVKNMTQNKIFCYILDNNAEVQRKIDSKSKELNKLVVCASLDESQMLSIEQWLNNIYNSDFVITDSYHGTVFSVLFNKPFLFLGNSHRGNTRIESLFEILNIKAELEWAEINQKIQYYKRCSIRFLEGGGLKLF